MAADDASGLARMIIKNVKDLFCGACWMIRIAFLIVLIFPALAFPQKVTEVSSGNNYVEFIVELPEPKIHELQDGSVEISFDGFGVMTPAGAPELPGKVLRVAVPGLGSFSVDYELLERVRIGEARLKRVKGEKLIKGKDGISSSAIFDVPDPWPEDFWPEPVKPLEPSYMGRLRVLPVRVIPIVREGEIYFIIRKLRIRVSFEGSLFESHGSGVKLVSSNWRNLYDKLIVNREDVQRFIRPIKQSPVFNDEIPIATKRLKIRIPETGFYFVRADSLISAGLSAGLSTDEIAVVKYYYDERYLGYRRRVRIPYLVIEDSSSTNGILDGGDIVAFYGIGIKDDEEAGDTDALYTDYNVYWIEEGTPGSRMIERTLPSQQGEPLDTFTAVTMERKDTYYFKYAPINSRDFYYLKGNIRTTELSLPFQCTAPPATGGYLNVYITVESDESSTTDHLLQFFIKNSGGSHFLGSKVISGKNRYDLSFESFPSDFMVNGSNELLIVADASRCYLVDRFSVSYTAYFRANDDFIDFKIGSESGLKEIQIDGFSSNRAVLVDLTDPDNQYFYMLDDSYFLGATKNENSLNDFSSPQSYTLTINLNVSPGSHFAVIGLGTNTSRELPTSLISVDNPSSILATSGNYNVAVIYNREFLPTISDYISRREEQGYRVIAVDVEDIFDEFNGGNPSAIAVKRFIKFGVDHWGLDFVLLVGDANEDHKRVLSMTPPDYVPTYTFCAPVVGDYSDEVTASDMWYAFLDDMSSLKVGTIENIPGKISGNDELYKGFLLQDRYPDVFIGRLPAGSGIEVRAMRVKIEKFEDAQVDDIWRRRIILFADDRWSGTWDYRYHEFEREFEESMEDVAQQIENVLPGGFDIRRLYLSHWTDGIHENTSESGPQVRSKSIDSVRTYFTPYLIRELNNSCLFFTFQGHANRTTLTSEAAFASFAQYDDLDSLRTYIPSVFVGFGCHISDFALRNELEMEAFSGPGGDCFSEQMLLKPGAGAVGTYASSGFEYLTQNAFFCRTLNRVIFESPPMDSVPPSNEYTGAHWTLGKLIFKACIEQIDATIYGRDQILRYVLLGDPMLKIDPGPPLVILEADWGEGWVKVDPGNFIAQNGTNRCKLRFTASDVVALGSVRLKRNGEDITDSLTITRNDTNSTYPRSFIAEMDLELSLSDESLEFSVFSPEGELRGVFTLGVETSVRLIYKDYLEIQDGSEAPPRGDFKVEADFPIYLDSPPLLFLDERPLSGVSFIVPDESDSLHWEARFEYSFPAGYHELKVKVDDFEKVIRFSVSGNEIVAELFNFPNPFSDGTNIIYTLNLPADWGRIDIYNVSGVLVKSFELSSLMLDVANYGYPHSIYWDGRDMAGDRIANGTYICLIRLRRGGEEVQFESKMVKLE